MWETQYVSLLYCFYLYAVTITSQIHFSSTNVTLFFLWLKNSTVQVYDIFWTQSFDAGHLNSFHNLTFVNKGAITTNAQASEIN